MVERTVFNSRGSTQLRTCLLSPMFTPQTHSIPSSSPSRPFPTPLLKRQEESNRLFGAVTRETNSSGFTPREFLQALVLVDDDELSGYPDEKALKLWKKVVENGNVHTPFEHLNPLTVENLLSLNNGLSHDMSVSHGKLLTLESLTCKPNEVEVVGAAVVVGLPLF